MTLPVIELREYTLHPGQRDVLIELFDREFIQPQEEAGIRVLGQFRDLDRPDRFVWMRGFPSMEARAKSLAAFYGGPVWKQHRTAANATMIDSDNVLLLQPAWPGAAAALEAADAGRGSLLVVSIHSFANSVELDQFAARFRQDEHGDVLAALKTEPAVNTFPALPVRLSEHVFAWLSRFTERALFVDSAPSNATRFFLQPTSRSRLRGR